MTTDRTTDRTGFTRWIPFVWVVVTWLILWVLNSNHGYAWLGFVIDFVMITVGAQVIYRTIYLPRARRAAQLGSAADGASRHG